MATARQAAAMTSLYSTIAPHFTQDMLTPGALGGSTYRLRVGFVDDGGVWQFLAPSLAQRLPLRAIEWRNLMGVTKHIDRLPINFVPADARAGDPPLVCIFLVKCEESESYKAAVKPRLAAWIDAMNAAKVEWMVLYVPLGTRRAKNSSGRGTPNAVYRKIFDRIRADFAHKKSTAGSAGGILGAAGAAAGGIIGGAGGTGAASLTLGERICKIDTLEGTSVIGQQQQHESQWSELLLRLRHCIMDAFQVKCFQYEEELRVLDAKRAVPGWDFGAFFLAKERLALMYQQMYLQDDAIRHLDELDAIFVNLSDSERRTFYNPNSISFTKDDPIFTAAPLALDLEKMQRAIARNRVSVRVVLLYSYCRQIRTLYLMGNLPQLLQRSLTFISSFLKQLRQLQESEKTIEWHQPFLWAVGTCLEVAYACELSWSGHDYQVSSASVPTQATQAITPEVMSRHLGEILYLARRVLNMFASASNATGYISPSPSPSETPTTCTSSATEDTLDDASTPWYDWLQNMFASRNLGESFERCVWEMSHLASLHFSRAGRHRFAVFLGGECAKYHVRHREFESASRLFRSHARQVEEDKWWALFGDCVRHICSSELALGRSSQAVAACFSMLQVAQEEKAELGREYLDQLMNALVESLDSQEREDVGAHDLKMNMGSLIRPTVTVETMQSPNSDLDHGEIRVVLDVSNRFPAGILVEALRVRFVAQNSANRSSEWSAVKLNEGVQLHAPSVSLDSAALDDINSGTTSYDNDYGAETKTLVVAHKSARKKSILDETFGPMSETPGESPNTDASRDPGATGSITTPRGSLTGFYSSASGLLLEESNVYLDERGSVKLDFYHAEIPVGVYECTAVECVLAGNTFRLLSPAELSGVRFEIAKRESTLQIELEGPPVLVPGSDKESVTIIIRACEDHVVDGMLEVQAVDDESFGIAVELLQLVLADDSKQAGAVAQGSSTDDGNRLLIAVPGLSPGDTLMYTIELAVKAYGAEPGQDISLVQFDKRTAEVVLAAQIRYQHEVSGRPPKEETEQWEDNRLLTTDIRRVENSFRVFRPVVEQVRLKRVDQLVFVGISLTCSDQLGLYIHDYRLELASDTLCNPAPELVNDLNTTLRGTKLRPQDTIHAMFTLQWPSEELTSSGHLILVVQYDESSNSAQTTHTIAIPVPLHAVVGPRYRIDVTPKKPTHYPLSAHEEISADEDITFIVRVSCIEDVPASQLSASKHVSVLYFDEQQDKDWILVGKQTEVLSLEASKSAKHWIKSTQQEYVTQKRMVPTRVGTLRFPAFWLRVDGQVAPPERVMYVQSERQVVVA